LQVEQALACVDFAQGAIEPTVPVADALQSPSRERLIACSHFLMWRLEGTTPFPIGAPDTPRILVCSGGGGHVEQGGTDYVMEKGTVMLLPAALGPCRFRPNGSVTLLDIAVPDRP
jgi:mannose-6-phosphate isomerase